jgi:RNA polymerase sigma factor for flagellar operon FliA
MDDLTSQGVLGLLDAASRFDPAKEIAFGIYARYRIRGAILDSLRDLDWASRETRRQQRRVETATRELSRQLQRNPTDAEVADKLNLTDGQWREISMRVRCAGPVSADSRDATEDPLPVPEHAASPETRPDNMCEKEQMKLFLDRALATLSPRYRKVVTLYYSGEMTMKEIGAMLGINESRVSQIHKLALSKLNAAMQAAGIHSATAFS